LSAVKKRVFTGRNLHQKEGDQKGDSPARKASHLQSLQTPLGKKRLQKFCEKKTAKKRRGGEEKVSYVPVGGTGTSATEVAPWWAPRNSNLGEAISTAGEKTFGSSHKKKPNAK